MTEFEKYAVKGRGISSMAIHDYKSQVKLPTFMTPNVIEERQVNNLLALDVFSRLMMDRIIFLGTPVDDTIANIINAQLLFLESVDKDKDVYMYINSPGGSVYAGYGMLDVMSYISPKISTVAVGLAASMGCVLLAGGEKGKRLATRHSRIMMHQPLGGADGQASDIEIVAREINKIKKELYLMLSEATGKDIETIERDADRDKWFDGEEALEYGFIDEIVTSR